MSIELDWQIVEDEPQEPGTPPQPPVHRRWRWPRISRKVLAAVVLILVAAIAGFAVYYDRVYHAQLDQVTPPVLQIARFEAQAVLKGDRDSYLAVQDPDDSSWREVQTRRFGRLEKEGLPEWGWKATDVQPVQGEVTLEPGGARLDVTYRFSVTQPMPNGPTSVTVVLPQYYKQTPSGWVRALPIVEYWGTWHQRSGKYFAVRYLERDAAALVPLVPRMDALLARVCDELPCPPQPIYVVFENSSTALENWTAFTYGFDDGSFQLKFPSPQLFGLPADEPSRDEFYRAFGTRVVEALVYEASGRHLNMADQAPQEIMRWELARAGLARPFVSGSLSAALRTTSWLPLSSIPLRSRPTNQATGLLERNVLLPLAFAFLEEQAGSGSVSRLLPAIGTSTYLGEAISKTLKVSPVSLEPAWNKYLRTQAGYALAGSDPPPPGGELALSCSTDNGQQFSLWRVRSDGTGLQQILPGGETSFVLDWSPDGARLTYMASEGVAVVDADGNHIASVKATGWAGWLPNSPGAMSDRLWITNDFDEGPPEKRVAHVVDLRTGEDAVITGTYHTWSPDGTRVAYFIGPDQIWVADADGRNARQLARGALPAWSPDSQRLVFWDGINSVPSPATRLMATEIQILHVASGAVTTLARVDELLPSASYQDFFGGLAWSPDDSLIAVPIGPQDHQKLIILSAESGAVRARQGGTLIPVPFLISRSWSPDGRYLLYWVQPVSQTQNEMGELRILDTHTDQVVTLPGVGLWDWSPDSKWLAVALQKGGGVLLTAPDLSSSHWLGEEMTCVAVAWRSGIR